MRKDNAHYTLLWARKMTGECNIIFATYLHDWENIPLAETCIDMIETVYDRVTATYQVALLRLG